MTSRSDAHAAQHAENQRAPDALADPLMRSLATTPEYQLIAKYYANRVANRSGLPYLKHINDGLEILDLLGADQDTMRAFAVHPLVQDDAALVEYRTSIESLDAPILLLAAEYRSVANSYNIQDFKDQLGQPRLSPLPEVNLMLLADKYQNLSDLLDHNAEHPDYQELCEYFSDWLSVLDDHHDQCAHPRLNSLRVRLDAILAES